MKLYFFGADYPPTGGGIATYSYEWITAMAGHSDINSIKVLIFGNKNPRKEALGSRVQIETLKRIGFFYVGYQVLSAMFSARDCDVFHSLNLFPVGFWVVFWGKVFGKKTCVTFYGTDACDTKASSKTLFLKRFTLLYSGRAITISQFTKEATLKKYNLKENRIDVIYPVVPKALLSKNQSKNNGDGEKQIVEEIRKKHSITSDQFIILSVARLVERKGIEYLIQAVASMKDPQSRLFIIGDGPERDRLSDLVKKMNLERQVLLLGKVADIIPFYALAHVATLVSYTMTDDGDFEGLGLVLLEAESYGVPVVGSRSGGIPEAFEENVTGLSVEPQNVADLARALSRLKNDRELRATLSGNTQSFLERKFGLKNTIDRYIELCKSL